MELLPDCYQCQKFRQMATKLATKNSMKTIKAILISYLGDYINHRVGG